MTAMQNVPSSGRTACAEVHGSGGGILASVPITEAKARSNGSVAAGVYPDVNLTVGGNVAIYACNNSSQKASADGYNGGIGAANSNHAQAVSNNTTTAYLQKDDCVNAYLLEINAGGLDDNYAEATAGAAVC
jgi:hypothetical protein